MVRNRSGKEYYGILGVSVNATETEIRKAYRRLALQRHPDRNPGNPAATEQFKEISEAYGVLIDSSKRLQYDQSRQSGAAESFGYTQDDILRDLFRNPGANQIFEELAREFERMGMRVDRHYFDQVLFGGRAHISGGIFIVSPFAPVSGMFRLLRSVLTGSGAIGPESQARSLPKTPKLLSGIARIGKWLLGKKQGEVEVAAPADVTQSLELTATEASEGGSKQITICADDDKTEQVMLTIPAGIKSGARLRLRGKGLPRTDGTRGDLYLLVNVM
jgi:curved DNA-binding protein